VGWKFIEATAEIVIIIIIIIIIIMVNSYTYISLFHHARSAEAVFCFGQM
jgi:hypothetical protein